MERAEDALLEQRELALSGRTSKGKHGKARAGDDFAFSAVIRLERSRLCVPDATLQLCSYNKKIARYNYVNFSTYIETPGWLRKKVTGSVICATPEN